MSKKNLIQLIQKTAQELEDAPGVAPPPPNLPPPPPPPIGTSVETVAPAPSETRVPSPAAPPSSVIKMQTELKNLAGAMTQQVNLSQLGGPNKQLGPGATPEQQRALGRMSFADFISQHYTRGSDIPGVELDWDPSKTNMTDKDPSRPTRTNVVMDTMQRIGQPNSEFKIDGVWGPRTNASLRNAYATAFGLLEMSKDFGYQPRAYSVRDLAALKQLIPHTANDISQADKIKRAGDISPHLHAIHNLFQEVEDHILNKTQFKPYIEGMQAYTTYGPGMALDPRLVAELNQKFTNMKVVGEVGGQQVAAPITVEDLVSLEALERWQQKNMPEMRLHDVLTQVKKNLDATDPAKRA